MDTFYKDIKKRTEFVGSHSMKESLYIALKEAILIGEVPVGSRINELYLAETLNVSRTPVRESLRLLKEDGLVESVRDYGSVVIGVTEENREEVEIIMRSFDSLLLSQVKQNTNEEEEEYLNSLISVIEREYQEGNHERALKMRDHFYLVLIDLAKMPILKDLLLYIDDYKGRSYSPNDNPFKDIISEYTHLNY